MTPKDSLKNSILPKYDLNQWAKVRDKPDSDPWYGEIACSVVSHTYRRSGTVERTVQYLICGRWTVETAIVEVR